VEDTFNSLTGLKIKVCYKCFNKFNVRNESFKINGIDGMVLYYYDEFFKELLYRYKGAGDYLLKDAFLTYNLKAIKRKYKGYSLVLAPSNENAEIKRGFSHLEHIFKSLDLPIIKCFEKNCIWKQSDKKLGERMQIQNVIKIDKRLLNGVKKVLIVDDVLTSGSTIKAMINQIPPNIYKKVFVLASNCQILANEIV
jgi:predicted amidophosphoribosyltransferase